MLEAILLELWQFNTPCTVHLNPEPSESELEVDCKCDNGLGKQIDFYYKFLARPDEDVMSMFCKAHNQSICAKTESGRWSDWMDQDLIVCEKEQIVGKFMGFKIFRIHQSAFREVKDTSFKYFRKTSSQNLRAMGWFDR